MAYLFINQSETFNKSVMQFSHGIVFKKNVMLLNFIFNFRYLYFDLS